MMSFLRKNGILLAAVMTGIAGGILYWHYIGCTTGSCPITSHWYSSAFFGGIFGYVAGDFFRDSRKKNKPDV